MALALLVAVCRWCMCGVLRRKETSHIRGIRRSARAKGPERVCSSERRGQMHNCIMLVDCGEVHWCSCGDSPRRMVIGDCRREVWSRSASQLDDAQVDAHEEHDVVQFVKLVAIRQRLCNCGWLSDQKAVVAMSVGPIARTSVRVAELAKPVHQMVLYWLLIGWLICQETCWQ